MKVFILITKDDFGDDKYRVFSSAEAFMKENEQTLLSCREVVLKENEICCSFLDNEGTYNKYLCMIVNRTDRGECLKAILYTRYIGMGRYVIVKFKSKEDVAIYRDTAKERLESIDSILKSPTWDNIKNKYHVACKTGKLIETDMV